MINKVGCTGCSVCADVCPQRAITMSADNEGFLVPEVDASKCIHCNVCDKICPLKKNGNIDNNIEYEYYSVVNRNTDFLMASASGGVFSLLAEYVLSKKGYVWGALYKEDAMVGHGYVNRIDDLYALRRSKYVQSDTRGIYKVIKEQLAEGKYVLFSGTPCQTTALANYVGNRLIDNLILVDIVCHGVPTPMIWKAYLEELSRENNESIKDIIDIEFKYKEGQYIWRRPGFKVLWRDGKKFLDYANQTWYENGYLSNLFVRPSCHKCQFKNFHSVSDITIGDYWGCSEADDIYNKYGVSLVVLKTSKGKDLFESIKDGGRVNKIDYDKACINNPRIHCSSMINPNRKKFWRLLPAHIENGTIEKLVNECMCLSVYQRIMIKISSFISNRNRK